MKSLSRLSIVGLLIGLCSIVALPALATHAQDKPKGLPHEILVIRHAEKPPEDAKSVDLSAEGKMRADALPRLFEKSDKRPKPFAAPDFIFATKNTKHSHRPLETVTPLAKKLKLMINSDYADEEYGKLAEHIFENTKYAGKTILIAWHHGKIPELAQKLKVTNAPEKWNGSVFDRVWQITYDEQGKAVFETRPQQLLPGDSDK
jgi:hypothetical protein